MLSRRLAMCNSHTTRIAVADARIAIRYWSRSFNRASISAKTSQSALALALDSHYDEPYAAAFDFDTRESRKDYREMIHYSCDMCKCELDPKHDVSYVVRMEVYPAPCEADAAIDNDRDYLEDIHEVLERYDEFEADGQLPENDTYQNPPLRSVPRMLRAVPAGAVRPHARTAIRFQQALKPRRVRTARTLTATSQVSSALRHETIDLAAYRR